MRPEAVAIAAAFFLITVAGLALAWFFREFGRLPDGMAAMIAIVTGWL
jgi:hypothetical protein